VYDKDVSRKAAKVAKKILHSRRMDSPFGTIVEKAAEEMPSVEKKQASSLSSKSPQHVPQLRNSSAIAEELSQRSHYRLYVKRKHYPLRTLRLCAR